MGPRVLVVSASTDIARPIPVVRLHFGDVEHHVANAVHPDVEFMPLPAPDGERRFRKTVRVLGVRVDDEVVLRRQPDGSITEDTIAGPNKGMRLVSSFRAEGPERTVTTLTVELPLRGLRRLFVPWLRRLLARRLSKGLEEDRRDLEGGRYHPGEAGSHRR